MLIIATQTNWDNINGGAGQKAAKTAATSLAFAARPYSIDKIHYSSAFFIEIIIASASLIGRYLLTYKSNSNVLSYDFLLAMLGPCVLFFIEFLRVPLAFFARTQASLLLRIVLTVAFLASAVITTESLSQIITLNLSARRKAVINAETILNLAQADLDAALINFDAKKNIKDQIDKQINDTIKEQNSSVGSLGTIKRFICRDKRTGRIYTCPDAGVNAIIRDINKNNKDKDQRTAKQNAANIEFDRAANNKSDKQKLLNFAFGEYKKISSEDQISQFAATMLRESPSKVTEDQVYLTLFVLSLVPSILASLASSILAMGSIHIIPIRQREFINLSDDLLPTLMSLSNSISQGKKIKGEMTVPDDKQIIDSVQEGQIQNDRRQPL